MPPEIALLTQAVIVRLQQQYASELIAVYLIGSLAHGGFSLALSDIDIALIFNQDYLPHDIDTIKSDLTRTNVLAERLSFFYSNEEFLCHQIRHPEFPLIDRVDLLASGKLIFGKDIRRTIPYPNRQDILTDCAQLLLNIINRKQVLKYLSQPELLCEQPVMFVSKLILYPIRVMRGLLDLKIVPLEAAVKWYLTQAEADKARLVQLAYAWRAQPHINISRELPLIAETLPTIYQDCLSQFLATSPTRYMEISQ